MPPKWTAQNIPDLTAKVIIITGANSGIGYEAAKEFARKGARVVMACRSMKKAQSALKKIETELEDPSAEIILLDLANLESVRDFVNEFQAKYNQLDVLLNNAGIMMVPFGKTEDGFERHLGTNHLGHFALTGLLFEQLTATPGSRIVNVSSIGHTSGAMDFENLQFEDGKGYTPMGAYGRSKLANLLFTYELQRRLEEAGKDTIATAAHPGLSNTALADHMLVAKIFRPVVGLFLQSAAMGALPSIRASVDPTVNGGEYYGPGGANQMRGYPVLVQSNRASHNKADARKLWQISQELTGIHYL